MAWLNEERGAASLGGELFRFVGRLLNESSRFRAYQYTKVHKRQLRSSGGGLANALNGPCAHPSSLVILTV
jgi:hypothetical protein